jgi:hypothetical protein
MIRELSLRPQSPLQTSIAPLEERAEKPRVTLLSSSLLTDRILLHTGVLERLEQMTSPSVWATSAGEDRFRETWESAAGRVEPFPEIFPFREVPHNYLRRLNDFVWDYRQSPPSRLSMMRHVRDKRQKPYIRGLKLPARLLAALRAENLLERQLEKFLLRSQRSPEAIERFRARRPDLLVTTGPHRYEEPAVVLEAKKLGIPILAFLTSWDNLSTKNRTVFRYDGFLVWSERMKSELHHFYPYSRQLPISIIGAPQFDVFFDARLRQSREEFCAAHGLRPELPIILYALGSPNFLPEDESVAYLAERVANGALGEVQLLVRPHPIHDNAREAERFRRFAPRVVVQKTGKPGAEVKARSQDRRQVMDWVNSFRHADVVVNLSSTAAVDAAIFDRPVVNLDFDPQPGQPNQALIKEINHTWTHFKPVAESGGLWLVDDLEAMVEATRTYLKRPDLHREGRRWVAEFVCEYLDGLCGERMAQAIYDFTQCVARRATET